MNRTILSIILGGMYMQAAPGESGGTPNPQAMSVETLNAIPDSIKNAGVPAGRSFMNEGLAAGQAIIAAEQAIQVAQSTEQSTRLDTLKALCEIADDVGRNQFIGGIDNAFIAVSPGGKKSKTHQNFLTEARRVSGFLLDEVTKNSRQFADVKAQALGFLNATEPGQPNTQKKYAAKLSMFPTRSNAGGNTRTGNTGGNNGQQQTTQQQSNGAQQLAKAPDNQPQGQTGAVTETYNRNTLIANINTAHENDLDAATVALANRLKKSSSPLYQSWGAQMLDFDGIGGQTNEQKPQESMPLAVNG